MFGNLFHCLLNIGKGKDNRVFNHMECALESETENDKYDKIREILNSNKKLLMTHLVKNFSTRTRAVGPNVMMYGKYETNIERFSRVQ